MLTHRKECDQSVKVDIVVALNVLCAIRRDIHMCLRGQQSFVYRLDVSTALHSPQTMYCCGGMNRLYCKVRDRFGSGNSGLVTICDQPTGSSFPKVRKPEVAVAPQVHASKSRHRHQKDSDLEKNQQFHPLSERRGSNGGLVLPAYQAYIRGNCEERLVDGPPQSPKDARVASLEQRVRELEAMVVGQAASSNNSALVIPVTPQQTKPSHSRSSHAAPPTQLIISNSSPSSSVTHHLMAKEVVSKEVEIERLQRQQADYNEEIRKLRKDSENSKEELRRVVNKLNDLEAESMKCQEKAKTFDTSQLSAIQEKLRFQEKELTRLRIDLAEKERMLKHYDELKKELNYLELQNETLHESLDAKENTVKELERHVASLRMEATLYQQSCSSGSTPLADETESLADIKPPFAPTKPYTKAIIATI
ncbi:hypothetical protein DICVIV_02353 [Dictyocaulus viviparus]|uniref:Uncharacterized protein n=1 Tax=Dictyocaulus viviparus TaxID=29172 RepID=A0A0D8Y5H0_DICVI|nr:hypothetical protein DICVIV_02353 [Dictyocaulus viviparus]